MTKKAKHGKNKRTYTQTTLDDYPDVPAEYLHVTKVNGTAIFATNKQSTDEKKSETLTCYSRMKGRKKGRRGKSKSRGKPPPYLMLHQGDYVIAIKRDWEIRHDGKAKTPYDIVAKVADPKKQPRLDPRFKKFLDGYVDEDNPGCNVVFEYNEPEEPEVSYKRRVGNKLQVSNEPEISFVDV
jgi:hypothetical protein